jgi:hypothetical protein
MVKIKLPVVRTTDWDTKLLTVRKSILCDLNNATNILFLTESKIQISFKKLILNMDDLKFY